MSCERNSRNATPPAPAIAPGAETIDVAAFARSHRVDPRLAQAVPGFDAPFFQAGLAGYSDAAMRIVARRQGCPYCVTEALLDRTLLAGGRGFAKADLGELHDNVPGGVEDHPLAGQIMGSDPGEMAQAALQMIERNDRPGEPGFAAIDVNLACPVKKIRKKARGGHFLREPEGAVAILREVRQAVPPHIPVTVKLRRAWDETPESHRNFHRIFDAAYELGCAWATVHGRTVEQKYVGPSDWRPLRDLVRRYPDRVILGSGDIWTAADIFRMLAYTGVSAVSVARGAIGDPWIFRQARQLLAAEAPTEPTLAQQRAVLEEHFRLSVAVNGPKRAPVLMRKFAVRFSQRHPRREQVRLAFLQARSVEDWLKTLEAFYPSDDELMDTATDRTAA